MLTKDMEDQCRAKINPEFAETIGTESYERNLLFGEIDRLRAQIKELIYE